MSDEVDVLKAVLELTKAVAWAQHVSKVLEHGELCKEDLEDGAKYFKLLAAMSEEYLTTRKQYQELEAKLTAFRELLNLPPKEGLST